MKKKAVLTATLAGLFIGGLSYWFQPYNQYQVFGIHVFWIMSIGSLIAAFILTMMQNSSPIKMSLYIALALVFAILARIIYDTMFWDSTSHNLVPFEIIPAGIISLVSALIGAYVAVGIKILTHQLE